MPKIPIRRGFSYFCLLFFFLFLETARPAAAGVVHDLTVRLVPEQHLLIGADTVSLSGKAAGPIAFFLSPRADIRRLTVDGEPARYRFHRGRVTVTAPETDPADPVRLRVEYAVVFDDPYPERPANTDNPGFGVTGIVGEKGTFLLSGAGWYPSFAVAERRFSITVDAPEGVSALTAGRSAGRKTEKGRTLSFWTVDRAVEGLSLSAARYIVTEQDADGIQVATYFTAETQPLSGRYIEAIKRYLNLYAGLFGPYPFEKFAVVENFFPTGYGFPSYTLMGGVVLRLPFIIDVSLGHEIAHCWWGNGVRVDYARGNWSEGLTTYVADYLYKEKTSPEAAEAYRRQWLRNYAVLVNEQNDFPLSEFVSRTDQATKVVGYDKAAMVFHMLRQILGEAVFWGGLRDLYREKRFQRASWEDFRIAFERRAGYGPCCTLENFFAQWIEGHGAPVLALDGVSRKQADGRWQVTGTVVQRQKTLYDLPVALEIGTVAGPISQTVSLHNRETAFSVAMQDRPTTVVLDPASDAFRRLYPEEIPASINSIKGADAVTVVVSNSAGSAGRPAAQMLVRALGLSSARIVTEADAASGPFTGARVFIGLPADPSTLQKVPPPVLLLSDRFSIDGRGFADPTDTFFGVFPDAKNPGDVLAVLTPVHPRFGPEVARKVTHYGKYSYLAFEQGKNAVKGVWPVTASPLMVNWE